MSAISDSLLHPRESSQRPFESRMSYCYALVLKDLIDPAYRTRLQASSLDLAVTASRQLSMTGADSSTVVYSAAGGGRGR